MDKLNLSVISGSRAKASDFNAVTRKVDEIVDALNNKDTGGSEDIDFPVTSVAGKTGNVTLSKTDVGLSNVENKSTKEILKNAALTGYPTLQNDPKTDAGIATKRYVDSRVAGLYRPMGSVNTYTDLAAKEADAEDGWVYNVRDTDMNYAWVNGDGRSMYHVSYKSVSVYIASFYSFHYNDILPQAGNRISEVEEEMKTFAQQNNEAVTLSIDSTSTKVYVMYDLDNSKYYFFYVNASGVPKYIHDSSQGQDLNLSGYGMGSFVISYNVSTQNPTVITVGPKVQVTENYWDPLGGTVSSGGSGASSDFEQIATDAITDLNDRVEELEQNPVTPNEVKCSLSEYYALRDTGQVDSNTKYYITNIDCDFEATEL